MARLSVAEKYDLYRKSVQSAESDAEFLKGVYRELKKKSPRILREDFCGTGLLAMEWVKLHPGHLGFGVDLDPEPMEYGRVHDIERLPSKQRSRVKMMRMNVMSPRLPKADISAALNFSYFLFKTRADMKRYFANIRRSLRPGGLAVFDCFGGGQCQDSIEDVTRHKGFTYYWEQTGFDPITNEAVFHIHFRVKGKKHKKVFTYDWRMWSIPELREILHEVGFKKTHIYWEGTTRKGEGNGVFKRVTEGEACLSWIAYIVAER